MSKVEDATPNFEEIFRQNRNSMAEVTRNEMDSRAASKLTGGRSFIGIFERYRRGGGKDNRVETKE